MSQTRAVVSSDAEISRRPSGVNASAAVPWRWLPKVWTNLPAVTSQMPTFSAAVTAR
jgi:hypothetical protein